jgi:hypothetical protein
MSTPPRKPFNKRSTPKVLNSIISAPTEHDMVKHFLDNDTDLRKQLTPERAEAVLIMIATGKTAKAAATAIGVNPGTVSQRAYDDPEGFGARLRAARQQAASTIFETMIEVAFDEDEDPRRSKLKIDVLDRMAKVYDRATYGDKLQVDQRTVTINMPDWTNDV